MRDDLYTISFDQNLKIDNPNVEFPLPVPDMPEERLFYNHDKKIADQKWQRTIIQDNYHRLPWQQKKEIADEMWHRRLNGEWWLIKDNPMYLPGAAFLFFNFWPIGTNKLPDFKMQCVWWFQVMDYVTWNDQLFGAMEIKPRRAHSTEMALCWMWNLVTQFRDSKGGIMSKSDKDATLAFDRQVFSAMNMHHIFKPKNTGSDRPQAQIEYQYPVRRVGIKNLNQEVEAQQSPALNSKIWFEPTVEGRFDGEKLRAALFDEIGKIKVTKMNVKYQWGIMRECMSLDVQTNIIGKCVLPSTIEELDNGESIAIVQDFWDESNPAIIDGVGRTISGCIRMFRPYWQIAEVDEYGYPEKEIARKTRNAKLYALESAGKHEDAADFRRRFPETVDEALAPPAGEASIPTELVDKQLRFLSDKGHDIPTKAIQGTLSWEGGIFGGNVIWTPDPAGKWFISRHPDKPNHRIILKNGFVAPGNTDLFAAGADPIDSVKPRRGGSDGAITVGMMHDPIRDSEISFDADNILIDEGMVTDACACDYCGRPKMPEEYYEDGLMTVIYFGCQVLVEYNKPGMVNWIYEKGFGAYCAQKPVNADMKWANQTQRTEVGISAVKSTIDNYYRHLKSHFVRRWKNYTHIRLLSDLRKLTHDNRGERDLSVAWGWTLTNMYGIQYKKKRTRARPTESDLRGQGIPLSVYKTTHL